MREEASLRVQAAGTGCAFGAPDLFTPWATRCPNQRSVMSWLWRRSEEAEVARPEKQAAAVQLMRHLCRDLLNPGREDGGTSLPSGSEDAVDCSGARHDIVPAAPLEVPSEAAMERFLDAYENDAQVASTRLRHMLRWRASHSYGLEQTLVREIDATTPGVDKQVQSGKCYILKGRDRAGRPIIVVHVRRHLPSEQSVDELTRFGVYILEQAEALLKHPLESGPAQEQSSGTDSGKTEQGTLTATPTEMCIVFNLADIGVANLDMKALKRIIYMLSNFYPERMGVCLLLHAPMMFSATWAIIRPWLSTRTQRKVHFVTEDQLTKFIAASALPAFWVHGSDTTLYSIHDSQ